MQSVKMENIEISAGEEIKLGFDTSKDPELKVVPLINLSNLTPKQHVRFTAGVGFIVLQNMGATDWKGNVYLTFDETIQKRKEIKIEKPEDTVFKDSVNILAYKLSDVLFNLTQKIDINTTNAAIDSLFGILHESENLLGVHYHTPDFRKR